MSHDEPRGDMTSGHAGENVFTKNTVVVHFLQGQRLPPMADIVRMRLALGLPGSPNASTRRTMQHCL